MRKFLMVQQEKMGEIAVAVDEVATISEPAAGTVARKIMLRSGHEFLGVIGPVRSLVVGPDGSAGFVPVDPGPDLDLSGGRAEP